MSQIALPLFPNAPLLPGDSVEVRVPQIGVLRNPVWGLR